MNQIAPSRPSATEEAWLSAAYDVLTESGVEAVKIMPLAARLGLTRSGFYWHFRDREALLEAMIRRWEEKNTGNLVARANAFADTIVEAMFNVFDCWFDDALFDSKLDLAIRNWARNDPALHARLDEADAARLDALSAMFLRFGYEASQARIRARTVLYTQVGYFSMKPEKDHVSRIATTPDYVEVFTGWRPLAADFERFRSRHPG